MKIIDNRLLAGVCVPGMSTKELRTQICATHHHPHPLTKLKQYHGDSTLMIKQRRWYSFAAYRHQTSLMTRVIIGVVFTAGGTFVLTIYALRTWWRLSVEQDVRRLINALQQKRYAPPLPTLLRIHQWCWVMLIFQLLSGEDKRPECPRRRYSTTPTIDRSIEHK
jgi:hypothetical protein